MKRKIIPIAIFALISGASQAQVGVGTLNPNKSAQLDVVASDKGILIPRVALQSTTDVSTITNGNVDSLLVFNTSTANDVTPGYYYWYTDKWVRLINQGDISLVDTNTTNQSLEVVNGELVLTDSEGNSVSVAVSDLVSVSEAADGSVTITIPGQNPITISPVTSVVENIQNQGDVYNEIVNVLTANSDTFVDNGNGTFTHTAVDGTSVTFNANTTTMVDNGDGTYTFTNEDGTSMTVDVINNVVQNIQNQGAVYNEIVNVLTANSDTFVDNGNGTFTHTAVDGTSVTFNANSTMVDNGDGTYTFTDAAGTSVVIGLNIASNKTYASVDSNYVVNTTDEMVYVTTTAGDVDITLPDPTQYKGRRIIVKKISQDYNYMYVKGSIDHAGTILAEKYQSTYSSGFEFLSDGVNWRVVAQLN